MSTLTLIMAICSLTPQAHARGGVQKKAVFEVDPFSSRAMVTVRHTFGAYDIPNTNARGEMEISSDQGIRRFWVAFGIKGFDSGNRTLNCHLQEALGLDYRQSNFPDRHVCENDRLPMKGKNAVRYPEVAFRSIDGGSTPWGMGDAPRELSLAGTWSIHGVDLPATMKIQFQKTEKGHRARGKSKISLKDFGVIVRGFLFISVKDEVQVEWDVEFRPDPMDASPPFI